MKLSLLWAGLSLVFCTYIWLEHTESVSAIFDTSFPAGQRFYLASKFLALLALVSLVLQVVFMLASRYVRSKIVKLSIVGHAVLGVLTFALIAGHSLSFIVAASLRGGSPAYALLLPNFQTGLYNAAVSLGLVAFYFSILLLLVGYFASIKKMKYARFHRILIWPIFLCVLVHSFAIGSESKTVPMLVFYALALFLIGWLLYRKQQQGKTII